MGGSWVIPSVPSLTERSVFTKIVFGFKNDKSFFTIRGLIETKLVQILK